jgi:hypothetical protein
MAEVAVVAAEVVEAAAMAMQLNKPSPLEWQC